MKRGDKGRWRSHGETERGIGREKDTERTEPTGRTVAASQEEPQYLVRSDKTGREAVHKPDALSWAAAIQEATAAPSHARVPGARISPGSRGRVGGTGRSGRGGRRPRS